MAAVVKTIGIILYRDTPAGRRFLLLHHRGKYWNFPKGRAEVEEIGDELATAFRELREETNIPPDAVRILPDFRATYRYHFRGRDEDGRMELVNKEAIFFLGALLHECPVQVSDEHLGWGWCDENTTRERLYYANGRRVFAEALRYLEVRQTSVLS